MASYEKIKNTLNYAVSLNPTTAFPLDARSMFGSYTEAVAAAATAENAGSSNTVYYIGQQVTVFENDVVATYLIQPDKTLKAVGAEVLGDNKSVVIGDGGAISLKSFGVEYYAYTETDGASSYTLTTGWKEGLQPRVVKNGSEYELAWYEPSTTTVEGLSAAIGTVQTSVDNLSKTVDDNKTATDDAIAAETARAEQAEAALQTKIDTNTGAITTLNADAETEGSVKNQIAVAIAGIMENPDESLNSIMELVEWCNNHAEDFLALQNDVTANQTAINGLEELVGDLPTGIQATTVIGYITEAVNTEKTRAEAAEKALGDRITNLESTTANLGTAAEKNVEFFATAAQGELADTAVQEVAAGANGHINVDGTDITVYEAPVASTTQAGDVRVDGTTISASEGVISVNAIDTGKVTGLGTMIDTAKEGAVTEANDYTDENAIAKTAIAGSADIAEDVTSASDEKVVSEKALLDALTWKTIM